VSTTHTGRPGSGPAGTSAEHLRTWLTGVVATHLRTPAPGVDPAVPLAEYGLDSVSAIALAAEVEDGLAVVLADDALWRYPTIDELAALLARELSGPAHD